MVHCPGSIFPVSPANCSQGPIYRLTTFGWSRVFVSTHELVDEVCNEERFTKVVRFETAFTMACSRPITPGRKTGRLLIVCSCRPLDLCPFEACLTVWCLINRDFALL
jgi:hypothetical protein